MTETMDAQLVLIDYTNHAKKRQVRTIWPKQIKFGISSWHIEPQWLLDATDVEKVSERTFAMKDINRWGLQPGAQMNVDLSLARQLQLSIERNARMVTRLRELAQRQAKTDPASCTPRELLLRVTTELPAAVAAILSDTDPA